MSGVRIRVLGSLEVEVGGRPFALGGRQQRALLALLVIHANDAVSADRLVDELWGEPTPARAVKRLQVAITRLRRALAAGGATSSMLASDAAGYTLRVQPGSSISSFERMLAEGRRQLEEAEPRRAAATLRDALALWRGEPFADVAFDRSRRRRSPACESSASPRSRTAWRRIWRSDAITSSSPSSSGWWLTIHCGKGCAGSSCLRCIARDDRHALSRSTVRPASSSRPSSGSSPARRSSVWNRRS